MATSIMQSQMDMLYKQQEGVYVALYDNMYKIGKTDKNCLVCSKILSAKYRTDIPVHRVEVIRSSTIERMMHLKYAKYNCHFIHNGVKHREWFKFRGNTGVILDQLLQDISDFNKKMIDNICTTDFNITSGIHSGEYHLEDDEHNICSDDDIMSDDEDEDDEEEDSNSDSDWIDEESSNEED